MAVTLHSVAPDFTTIDQDGHPQTLAQYRGQWVLLYFYPQDNTPGCTTEACQFRDYWAQLKDKVVILSVSGDNLESHQNFARQHRLTFPLLLDPDQKIIKVYGANGLITTKRISFLINPEGEIAKIYDQVNVDHHAQEVLDDVTALRKS